MEKDATYTTPSTNLLDRFQWQNGTSSTVVCVLDANTSRLRIVIRTRTECLLQQFTLVADLVVKW